MGIEKLNYGANLSSDTQSVYKTKIKEGSYIRVQVIKQLNRNHYLIEVKGNTYTAILKGSLLSNLFIAKVLKNTPKLELRYIYKLPDRNNSQHIKLEKLLQQKKSTFPKSITSDNFCINNGVVLSNTKREIKYCIRKSIQRFNSPYSIWKDISKSDELKEYLALQSLYNIYHSRSYIFLLPFIAGKKVFMGEVKQIRSPEEEGFTFSLIIHLDNNKKIGFLVFMDHEIIKCTVGTNDKMWIEKVRNGLDILEKGLESLGYDRKVEVDMVRDNNLYENYFEGLYNLKKIDIKM